MYCALFCCCAVRGLRKFLVRPDGTWMDGGSATGAASVLLGTGGGEVVAQLLGHRQAVEPCDLLVVGRDGFVTGPGVGRRGVDRRAAGLGKTRVVCVDQEAYGRIGLDGVHRLTLVAHALELLSVVGRGDRPPGSTVVLLTNDEEPG